MNLSESILLDVNLTDADLMGANLETILVNFMGGSLEDADFTNANLLAFGFFDLSAATLSTTCPDEPTAMMLVVKVEQVKFLHHFQRTSSLPTLVSEVIVTPYDLNVLHGDARIHPRCGAATIASALIIRKTRGAIWLLMLRTIWFEEWIVRVDGFLVKLWILAYKSKQMHVFLEFLIGRARRS